MEQNIDYQEGMLLFFKPVYFPDGGKPTRKFFLVLHRCCNSLMLVSLPTSKDHVPTDIGVKSGCIELPERNFNAFVFTANTLVTKDFSFDVNTFIYGCNIHEYDINAINCSIQTGKTKVEIKGLLLPNIFKELIKCLKDSDSVRRKYKKIL